MTKALSVSLAFLLLGASVPAHAGKPAPPPSAFVPEVIYRYNGNGYTDLRLSNAAGTAAVLLHRAPSLNSYDLAPPNLHMASFIETNSTSNRLMVRPWTVDGAGVISVDPARLLFSARGLLFTDFSPSGDEIAFGQWEEVGNLYTLKTVNVASGVVTTIASHVEPFALRWSGDGSSLIYANREVNGGVVSYAAYRQAILGGPPELLFRVASISSFDISRDGTNGLIVEYSQPGFTQLTMGKWDGISITPVPAIIGAQPHYSCGNDRLIYRAYSRTGQAGYVTTRTFATGADVVFSKDQNIPHADFMPC